MTRIILHHLDSKLQAAEARTDARIVRIETMLQAHIQENKEFKRMAQAEFRDIRKHLSSLKLQAIALAATVIFGVAGFNSTLVSNVIRLSDTVKQLHLHDQPPAKPQTRGE